MTKSGKHCGKRRNCSFLAISPFVTMFSNSRLLQRRQKAFIWGKGLTSTSAVCVEKSQSQDPLITGLEPGTFDTRGRRSTSAPLSSTIFYLNTIVTVWFSRTSSVGNDESYRSKCYEFEPPRLSHSFFPKVDQANYDYCPSSSIIEDLQ